jgi:hypothetical protein
MAQEIGYMKRHQVYSKKDTDPGVENTHDRWFADFDITGPLSLISFLVYQYYYVLG